MKKLIFLIFLFLSVSCAHAAPVLIQTVKNSANATTLSAAISPIIGDTMIVAVESTNDANFLGITDNLGDSYSLVDSQVFSTTFGARLYYLPHAPAGITNITVSFSGSTPSAIIAREYFGLSLSPLDKHLSANGVLGITISIGPTGVTVQDNELIIGWGATAIGLLNPIFSAGAGYGDLVQQQLGGGTLASLAMEDKIISAAASQTSGFTLGISALWSSGIATFGAMVNLGHDNLRLLGVGP